METEPNEIVVAGGTMKPPAGYYQVNRELTVG